MLQPARCILAQILPTPSIVCFINNHHGKKAAAFVPTHT
jgi:hypothetical protein